MAQAYQSNSWEYPASVTLASDGSQAYVSAFASGTVSKSIACFHRDPKTGRLAWLQTVGASTIAGTLGPTGLAVSPNNRFLYAAIEGDRSSLSVFERKAK